MILTQEQMRKCLAEKSGRCPGCGSLLIAAETCIEENSDGSALQPVECLDCGAEWTEHYTLTGISQSGVMVGEHQVYSTGGLDG